MMIVDQGKIVDICAEPGEYIYEAGGEPSLFYGEYSYRVTNPMLFYTNVCGNIEGDYTRDRIDSQLKSELLTALQPAFARISTMGIRYSALPGHTLEITEALNDVLSEK